MEDTTPYETAFPPVSTSTREAETAYPTHGAVCDGSGWRHTNAVRLFKRADGSTGYDPHHVRCNGCANCRPPMTVPSEARPQPEGVEETAVAPLVTYEAVNTTYSGEFNRIGDYDVYGDKMSFEQAAVPESDSGEEPLCETCGKPEDARCYRHGIPNLIHRKAIDCYPHHPFRARPQEVDEGTEWRRHSETGELEGLPVATWILNTPEWTHVRHVPLTLEQAIASRAVAEAEARSGDWRRLAGENGRLLREAVAQIDRLQARAERAEEDNARLRKELAQVMRVDDPDNLLVALTMAADDADVRAVEWKKAYRDRTVELTGAEEERDRLRALIERARRLIPDAIVENKASAWHNDVADALRESESVSGASDPVEKEG